MLVQPTLTTERLRLRSLTLTDAASIQQSASNRAIADTMISIPHPYPLNEAQRYISRQISESRAARAVTFAIEHQHDQVFCGIVEIRDIDRRHSQAGLSFWLTVEQWGQGYMSEVLQPILRFGFEDLDLNRLYAYHMARNPSSGKVLQKNGFQLEGLLRQRVRQWNVFEDVKLWAILRENWRLSENQYPSRCQIGVKPAFFRWL